MKKIVKYSKSSKEYNKLKNDFYNQEKKYLDNQKIIDRYYKKQPLRKFCKNCQRKILGYDLVISNIKYKFCKKCFHLNGYYQETDKFFKKIYTDKKGKNFSIGYKKNFFKSIKTIHLPKIKFLKSIIKHNFNLLDVGCGAGNLIAACEKLKINAVGIDLNKNLINYGSKHIRKNKLINLNHRETLEFIEKQDFQCVSLINVLEHLLNPNEVIDSFLKSKSKYLFINVPLFSLASIFDGVFKNNFSRQIGASHTHLYTKESLEFLFKRKKLKIIGELWYGLDFSDLKRYIYLNSIFYKKKTGMNIIDRYFGKNLEKFQAILDKNKLCSEVHMVLKK
tara:strand:- start:1878 stop:2882 length:1005 start_codon:yes stop_codon:yes gene_type:complete